MWKCFLAITAPKLFRCKTDVKSADRGNPLEHYPWGVNANYALVNPQANSKASEEPNKTSVFVDKKPFLIIFLTPRSSLEGIV